MTRSVWKGPFVDGYLLKKAEKSRSGGRHPVTPWGKPTKGKRTRSNKATDKFIVRSRHLKKGR
jgi:ribosomal protein S19